MDGSTVRSGRGFAVCLALAVVAAAMGATQALAQSSPVCVPPPSGMVAWWPGDGNALDLAGGNNATWLGTVAYTTGEVGQAFSLNGSSYLQVPSSASLSPTAAITIDAWIHPTATATSRIVDKITAGGNDGYLLDLYGGKLRLLVDSVGLSGATTLQANTTYHVAGTFDGTTMTVYVNGSSDGSVPYNGTIPVNALPVRIGVDSTGAANFFTGWVDEVEIFNRALSQAEIQSIVSAGPAGKCKGQPIPASSPVALAALALLISAAAALALARR